MFQLALAIGGTTVEELQNRMSHLEYVQWVQFAQHEPLGRARDDINTALLMFMIASVNRGKRGKKLALDDFLIDYWQDKSRPDVLARKLRGLSASTAGKESASSRS